MRAPAFWFNTSSPLGTLLAPLGWLYDAVGKYFRAQTTPEKIGIPVICVGNITLGGAGKTPVVIEIARRLRAAGMEAHILSRGYGGREQGPLRVDTAKHTAADVGDEPLLLARHAPVWIAKNKRAGAHAAKGAGAKLLILDDGFQNPSLHKDFSFLVFDDAGLGNGQIFPAGPLREKPGDALVRANAIIFLGNSTPPMEVARTRKTFLSAKTETLPPQDIYGKAVFAFAGIGNPKKFFAGLEAKGAKLAGTKNFPDHHAYSAADIEAVLQKATDLKDLPLTTEKDAMRLPPAYLPRVGICGLRLIWQDEATFEKLIKDMHGLR